MLKDPKVRDYLKVNFRLAWVNLEGDPDAGESNRHGCGESAMKLSRGIGKSNVQMLVLTPEGRVLHAVSGYIGIKDLRWELEQALLTNKLASKARAGGKTVVASRQNAIQRAMQRRPAKERSTFLGASHKRASKLLQPFTNRAVQGDRSFVREHPLMPIGLFQTRMLTGGGTNFFGYETGTGNDKRRLSPQARKKLEEALGRKLSHADDRITKRRRALRGERDDAK